METFGTLTIKLYVSSPTTDGRGSFRTLYTQRVHREKIKETIAGFEAFNPWIEDVRGKVDISFITVEYF